MFLRNIAVCVLFTAVSLSGFASDQKREADFAETVTKTLTVGKSVWLETSNEKFLALYAETQKKEQHGTIIIIHDMGGHPDQKNIIHALRTFVLPHRWSTLSIQMPVREVGADNFNEYYPLFAQAETRIKSAIDFAKKKGAERVVLAGYGLGAMMALSAYEKNVADIHSVITLSLAVPKNDTSVAQTLDFIKKVSVPMLDIYGSLDLTDVVDSARERQVAARDNKQYRQIKIDDEGHYYQHDEGLVIQRIFSWLDNVLKKEKAQKAQEESDKQNSNQLQ